MAASRQHRQAGARGERTGQGDHLGFGHLDGLVGRGRRISASSGSPDEADYKVFKDTYRASGNTWFATEANPFRFTAPGESYGQRRDWDAYRTLTGQDADSSFRDPGLTCPN